MAVNGDLSILNPIVLNGVLKEIPAQPALMGVSMVPRNPHPFPVAAYDIIQGSREVAQPTVPGAEATVVQHLGVAQKTARMLYSREKKIMEGSTLRWLREPGQLAHANAEAAVQRELEDLNARIEKFLEWCIWQMFTGTLTIATPLVNATVDYGMRSTHKPTASTLWTNPNATILNDVQLWKRLISRDSMAIPSKAILNNVSIQTVLNNTAIQNLLSMIQRETYLTQLQIPGLLGMNWVEYDQAYADPTNGITPFIPDNKVIFMSEDNADKWEVLEGPSPDDDSPEGTTGKFTKTWKEEDPSARQILVEYTFLPVLRRPDQIVYATVG